MAGFLRRVLHEVYEALQAGGSLHLPGPCLPARLAEPPAAEPARPGEPARLDGPPAGHPERLCPGAGLTPAERALERELDGGP